MGLRVLVGTPFIEVAPEAELVGLGHAHGVAKAIATDGGVGKATISKHVDVRAFGIYRMR